MELVKAKSPEMQVACTTKWPAHWGHVAALSLQLELYLHNVAVASPVDGQKLVAFHLATGPKVLPIGTLLCLGGQPCRRHLNPAGRAVG